MKAPLIVFSVTLIYLRLDSAMVEDQLEILSVVLIVAQNTTG